MQEAIERVRALGGGVVELEPSGTFPLQVPLVLTSNLWLEGWGAVLRNVERGAVTVATPPGEVTVRLHVRGLRIDAQQPTDGFAVEVGPLQESDLDVTVLDAAHGVRLHATPPVPGADPLLHANVCLNRFRFRLDRVRGTALRLEGESPVAVVTDNTFGTVYATRVGGTGVDLAQWSDSNHFGHTFVSLQRDGGVGVVLNSAGQSENRGVYNNLFEKVSVDAFGLRQATALRIFNSKLHTVHQLYTSPEGRDFPGPILDDQGCESYQVFSASESRWYARGVAPPPG